MAENDLCEADKVLPNGDTNFDINNCDDLFDVFRFTSRCNSILQII
jgi:hypothetical protein